MVHRFLGNWIGAIVLAALLAPARSAHAYCRTTTCAVANAPAHCVRDEVTQCHTFGAPLFWAEGCAAYSVHERGSPKLGLDYAGAEALVASAFAAWPTVDCLPGAPTIAVIGFGATSCDRPEFNREGPNSNTVIFRDLEWTHDPVQVGVTTVSFDLGSGRILSADIEVNTFGHSLTLDQAKFVVMHEAGHFLGLDHSRDPTAVMYSQYQLSPEEPVLTPDDVAGICATYPATRNNPVCEPEPHGGYAADCGGDVEGSCAMELGRATSGAASAIVLIVVVLRIARRRDRLLRRTVASQRP